MHLLTDSCASSQLHSFSSGPSLVTDAVFLGPYYLLVFICHQCLLSLSTSCTFILHDPFFIHVSHSWSSSSIDIFMSSLSKLKLSSSFHLEFEEDVKGIKPSSWCASKEYYMYHKSINHGLFYG